MYSDSETKEYRKNFSLLNYLKEGETLYDYIDRYTDLKDYSTGNLLNMCRVLLEKTNNEAKKKNVQCFYSQCFSSLTNDLKESLKVNPANDVKAMDVNLKNDLLRSLQEVSPDVKFNTIEEYVDFVKQKNFSDDYYLGNNSNKEVNPVYEKFNSLLVEKSVDVASSKTKNDLKYHCLKNIFISNIKHAINNKYDKHTVTNEEEWLRFSCFDIALRTPKDLEEYDGILKQYTNEVKKLADKKRIEIVCKAKREKYVVNELKNNMSGGKSSSKMNLEDILYNSSKSYSPQGEGSFKWNIKEFKTPKVVCDGYATYSGGEEMQRVIALSYGDFTYKTLFTDFERKYPSFASYNLELVGVTRLGKDGLKTYFVLVPFNNLKIKKANEITDKDLVMDLSVNGKKEKIMDIYGEEEYALVEGERVPQELKNFYLSVGLSDYHLENSTNKNFRYMGNIFLKDGKPIINSNYVGNAQDIKACRYAVNHSGHVGRKAVYNLEAYCNSDDLLQKHLRLVRDITNSEKPKDHNEYNEYNEVEER